MEKFMGKESKIATLENEVAGLKLILKSARQSLQNSLQKQEELENKLTAVEAEKHQALVKIGCLENTIHDVQRDVVNYRAEDLKMRKKFECLEKAMATVISPTLQTAIMAKVEDDMEAIIPNLAKELQDQINIGMLLNFPEDLEDSPASSARTASSESPQPSTSGMSQTNLSPSSDQYFY